MVVRTTIRRVGVLALNEVAPPGWGHTKAEKEKTKPDKPKSKIGGSAAAFKRALDDGRFKGLPGDKTYKDKKESMFKLMWSKKNKGAEPHYKPGTDEKKKKYQEEEVTYKQRDKELKKSKKAMDYRHKTIHKGGDDDVNEGSSMIYVGKKGQYHGPRGDHRRDKEGNIVASHYKKKPSPTGEKYGDKSNRPKTPKPADVRKRTKKGETTRSALNRAKKYEREKVRVYQGDAKRKTAKTGEYAKGYNEALTPMKDNNLFGNAYAGSYETLKKKIGSKKKHNKPAIQEGSFKDYMADAQAARDRLKKKIDDRKKKDAQFVDTKKHGVRFYDKKGKGRIKSGKKIYD